MFSFRRPLIAALPVLAAAATVLPVSTEANAYSGTTCDALYNCLRLFYNSNRQGSYTYFVRDNVPDFAPYKFLTGGAGQGQGIKNNAASADNDTSVDATIYYNSNYVGACDTLSDFAIADQLHYTYNENASFRWGYTRPDCYRF
ncbi:peptidase inhibitor family I36 protein [Streptomyces sp. NPDC006458]|uniref:peptidase inhibitor family I36 protein n=1 Tax=Streptomyces sp. NPDC006458 TaxID=3154302 RepID=UPI0033B43898